MRAENSHTVQAFANEFTRGWKSNPSGLENVRGVKQRWVWLRVCMLAYICAWFGHWLQQSFLSSMHSFEPLNPQKDECLRGTEHSKYLLHQWVRQLVKNKDNRNKSQDETTDQKGCAETNLVFNVSVGQFSRCKPLAHSINALWLQNQRQG